MSGSEGFSPNPVDFIFHIMDHELKEKQLHVAREQLALAYLRDGRDAERLQLYKERNSRAWVEFDQQQSKYVYDLFVNMNERERNYTLRRANAKFAFAYLMDWLMFDYMPKGWNAERLSKLAFLSEQQKRELVEGFIAGNLLNAMAQAEPLALQAAEDIADQHLILRPRQTMSLEEFIADYKTAYPQTTYGCANKLLCQVWHYLLNDGREIKDSLTPETLAITSRHWLLPMYYGRMLAKEVEMFAINWKYFSPELGTTFMKMFPKYKQVLNPSETDKAMAIYAILHGNKQMFPFPLPNLTKRGLENAGSDKLRQIAHCYLMATQADYAAYIAAVKPYYLPDWAK